MMKLYNYWRSGTSHRTRIALALKGIDVEYVGVDLREGEHKSAAFLARNPQGLVPTLELEDDTQLSQSPAIIEYLEEVYPSPSLLSDTPVETARIRAMAALVGCDVHPLNNLRVLKYLKGALAQEQTAVDAWIANWITVGFEALEKIISTDDTRGDFCFGGRPTLVECYLIPQIYSAERFNVDLSAFPELMKVNKACSTLQAFEKAHPTNQPDAD
jgi:maleylpyruvate isomerase